jgi:hypothetical protein
MITGQNNALVDYYVEAVDSLGNITRSDIQHVYVGNSVVSPGPSAVAINPAPAVAGQPVTITYEPSGGPLAAAGQVYLHYGFNNWQTVAMPDALMTWNADDAVWGVSVPVGANATQLDVVFNNGSGVWDNHNGADWHFAVTGAQPPAFLLDGVRDAVSQLVAANGSRHLYAALNGDTLYVATEDAGEGNDVFIYLADAPGPLTAANWAKAGQIAEWDAFLADENDNDYESWFDATGTNQAATGANGGVLEGILNLAQEFGSLPAQIYLAVGVYATANGGALVASQQVPASVIANGNIEAAEYFLLQLVVTPGDYDRDGDVDDADYNVWRSTFGSASDLRADANGDGKVDTADYVVWRKNYGATASGAYLLSRVDGPPAAPVPEPATWILGMFTSLLVAARRRAMARP